jgi:hypothetical protein
MPLVHQLLVQGQGDQRDAFGGTENFEGSGSVHNLSIGISNMLAEQF